MRLFRVVSYIRVEEEEPAIYDYKSAKKTAEQMRLMQPEDLFLLEEIEQENNCQCQKIILDNE